MFRPVLVLLVWLLAACGGSSDPTSDAAAADAVEGPIDAVEPDAADPCELLCSCAETNCDLDLTACMTECAGLPASVRTCRTMHCGYAQQNPAFHCPHVEGDPEAAGTPLACIAP